MKQNNYNLFFPLSKVRAGAIALALMALLLPACTNNAEPEVDEPNVTEPAETDGNATVEDVAEDTEELFGQEVTVRGEPTEILDDVSFTISDGDFFDGDEILIVNKSGEPFVLPEGDDVEIQVTGEVRQFSAFDFQEEFELDWTPGDDYGERPTIVAESIALAPAPGQVTDNPEEYYGQIVAVEGEVEEVVDATTFTLEEEQVVGGEDLTVINLTEPTQGIVEENQIVVTGEVRSFVLTEIERDYELTWDLDLKEKLEAEYSDKPVLIATGIYPSAKEGD
ncbi:MAG: hypothetical protein SW833_25290 [Cyanobacteriota bacterium]|nr:hypothetical protein [Cyanobacteriota bacterium]